MMAEITTEQAMFVIVVSTLIGILMIVVFYAAIRAIDAIALMIWPLSKKHECIDGLGDGGLEDE